MPGVRGTANRKNSRKGRFWEGRFKAQPVLDEQALAACLAYVDHIPVRARIAATPEASRFTSVYERTQWILAEEVEVGAAGGATGLRRERKKLAAMDSALDPVADHVRTVAAKGSVRMELSPEAANRPERQQRAQQGAAHGIGKGKERRTRPRKGQSVVRRAAWLSPFEFGAERSVTEVPGQRASNKGCLEMTFAEYLQLLGWTGRQIRRDKRGVIPVTLAPILERMSVKSDGWLKLVTEFSRLFRRSAGTPISLGQESTKWGRKRREGIAHSRAVFQSPA